MTDDLSIVRPDPRPEPSVGGIGRPKRRTPTRALPAEVAAIKAAKCLECRLCGASAATVPVNAAHLVPRGMGGTIGGEWVPDNIIGLCGHGNLDGCHGLIDRYDPEARTALRAKLTQAELAYIERKMGRDWLDRRYPTEVPR